ncbi:helix-turn-helix domain-containing protein [Pseudonocardia tropica]|uniref:Helix-turn-helix domain-containing protein n=1 Tax=Pseudonocardia tropica TaxID=681289 RepID=A0ABV1JXR5_9PSEU
MHVSKDLSQPLHRVVVLVDEGGNPFEFACLTEVLGIDRPEVAGLLYRLSFCTFAPEVTVRQGFFTMTGLAGPAELDRADTLVVPNRPDVDTPGDPQVLRAIRRAHERGARLVGMCTGAFTLARAGVLDGRRATLHWQWADRFRAEFPGVDLHPDVLFVDDGDVLTAAGSAAALDLGLHLVGRDHGADVAAAVARRLVFTGHRPGGQRQFVETPMPVAGAQGPLAAVVRWALGHLDEPVTVDELARRAGVSRATLHRHFRRGLGVTPLDWLHAQRVARARRLLEVTDLPVERVAALAGLGSGTSLRTHLRTATGLTPSAYRAARRGGAPAGPVART